MIRTTSAVVREYAVVLLAGVLFAIGLVISGMTLPSKVFGFLDVAGHWKPALMLVMGGAIGVHAIAHVLIRKRAAPLLASQFSLPTRTDIDARLLLGAAIFGIGWGIGGLCPGPALVSVGAAIVTLNWASPVVVFVVSMLAGMKLFALWEQRQRSR